MTKKILLVLFFNIILYSIAIIYFDSKDYQMYSIVTQLITLGIAYLLSLFEEKEINTKLILENDTSVLLAVIIIVLNAVIGIFNIIHTIDLIDFNQEQIDLNLKNLVIYTSSASIILSQIGGFFIQLFLIYFLSVIMDFELRVKEIFMILGTAYLGFFIISAASLAFNIFTLETFPSVAEFNSEMEASNSRIILGKLGEYMTLNIAI